jgi:ATP-binding cassette, subfamily F, member 3
LNKLHQALAKVEAQLADSGLYEAARKDELRERLAEQATLKAREAELEESWLLALETLEALQQQLEETE